MSFAESALARTLWDLYVALKELAVLVLLVVVAVGVYRQQRQQQPPKPPKKRTAEAEKPKEAAEEKENKEEPEDEVIEDEEEEEEGEPGPLARAQAEYVRLEPRTQLAVNVGALVVGGLLLVGLVLWARSGTGTAAPGSDDLRGPLPMKLGRWYDPVHYYTTPLFRDREGKLVPYVACQHVADVEAVHTALLGPKPSRAAEHEFGADEKRARALKRCVLERGAVLKVDDHANGHDLHIGRRMLWEYDMSVLGNWLVDAPVTHMFITQRGERFYRVLTLMDMGRGNQFCAGLVSERELLAAAGNWYHNMILEARPRRFIEDGPCLCDVHLGIYASGISFAYDAAHNDWTLRLDVSVVRPLAKPNGSQPITYHPDLPFPSAVDRRLRLGLGLEPQVPGEHHGIVQIEYVDPRAIAAEVEKRQLFSALDSPNDELGLAGVVNIAELVTSPARHQISDADNDCVHYCLALDRALRKRFAGPGGSAVATVGKEGPEDL